MSLLRLVAGATLCSVFCFLAPLSWGYSSPQPLPAGVRAVAYVYGFGSGVDSRLNDSGELEFFSRPLNRSVTLDDMGEFEPDLLRLKSFLADLEPEWAENLIVANLYSELSVFESRKVSGALYGITDRLSLGVLVPWIRRDVAFDFSADVQNNAAAIAKQVGNNPQLQDGLDQLANYPLNEDTFMESVFLNRGYQSPRSTSFEGWGDMELEARYTYLVSSRWSLGLRGGLILPTGSHDMDITNPLDLGLSESVWAARLSHLSEYYFVPDRVSWATRLGYKHRFAKKQTRAYALSADELLPDLTDPNQIETVTKTIGSEFSASSGFQWSVFRGYINLMASYFYSQKATDKIEAARGLDYARETAGTNAMQHGIEAAVEISTLKAFQRDDFMIPSKFMVSYVHPVGGRNTIYSPYWRFDSVLLF